MDKKLALKYTPIVIFFIMGLISLLISFLPFIPLGNDSITKFFLDGFKSIWVIMIAVLVGSIFFERSQKDSLYTKQKVDELDKKVDVILERINDMHKEKMKNKL